MALSLNLASEVHCLKTAFGEILLIYGWCLHLIKTLKYVYLVHLFGSTVLASQYSMCFLYFQVEMHKCFRPGDIIIARVVSLTLNRHTKRKRMLRIIQSTQCNN